MKSQTLRRGAVPVTLLSLFVLAGCSEGEVSTRNEPITGPVTVSVDDRTLTVMAGSGGCDEAPQLRAFETLTTVSLAVHVTTRIRPGEACPADARFGPARVTLQAVLLRDLTNRHDGSLDARSGISS
ncbi:hypothetical protein [Streptomyces sp. NPDC001296]